ncbi:MAG: TPM domain-containing protein [Bacteroidota bacterium]
MDLKSYFSEAELKEIETAVSQAETETSGEIVPVFVAQCERYPEAVYKGGIFLAMIVFLIVSVMELFWLDFPVIHLVPIMGMVVAGGIVGALLTQYIDPLKRLMAGRNRLEIAAIRRAEHFFIREEVFMTRERTGILIFMALFEHEVVVLADEGINGAVEQETWNDLIDETVHAIKKKNVCQGIINAINRSAKILKEKGVEIRPDDTDELPNQLRTD